MALDSSSSAHWEGDLMTGSGTTTLGSGAAGPLTVNWKARSEEQGGITNPEELIAAAPERKRGRKKTAKKGSVRKKTSKKTAGKKKASKKKAGKKKTGSKAAASSAG